MDKLSIVVATKNSAGHFDLILEHYRRLGWRVFVFVDDSSTDDTYQICCRLAYRTELIRNPLQRAVGVLEAMSRRVPTDWILRFDDDEVPTRAMLADALKVATDANRDLQFAYLIRNCLLDEGGSLTAVRFYDSHHWRLYNRATARFSTGLHTAGIAAPGKAVQPPELFFLHLHWIVRRYEERRRKIEHYYQIQDIKGDYWRKYYLVEEASAAWGTAAPLDLPELEVLSAALAERFPGSLRLPTAASA